VSVHTYEGLYVKLNYIMNQKKDGRERVQGLGYISVRSAFQACYPVKYKMGYAFASGF